MNVFGAYAQYYNLLYQDKDYAEEVQYIQSLLRTYAPAAQHILELGCGTGMHACLLAEFGYYIHGIDQSEEMLRKAGEKLPQYSSELAERVTFQQGDIRAIQLDKSFDAVLSLFHVMSYQALNEDLGAVFKTVHAHLKTGGVFLFDFWYGPAVLTDRPVVRVKRFENERLHVTRIAEPVMYPNENIVQVMYDMLVEDKDTHEIERICETHTMRYWFLPELEYMLTRSGLTVLEAVGWMKPEQALGFETWNGMLIVQKS